jgi:hypothetical protein
MFTASENSDDIVDINRAWESIIENIKVLAKQNLGYYEWRQHKLWLDKECSKLLHRRKSTKFQLLQNPIQLNCDNLKKYDMVIKVITGRIRGGGYRKA